MSTVLDTKLRPKVVSLLGKYGTSYVIGVNAGAYNPGTGATASSVTSYTVDGSPPTPYSSRYIDGDLIRHGDLWFIIAGQDIGFTPKEGQLVTFQTKKFHIVSVEAMYSGDLIAAYRLQVRK